MESSNLYELQQQQLATYSSLAAAKSTVLHQWNPSLPLSNDDYEHYMNEILPISAEILRKKKDINIGCDDEYGNPCTVQNENAVLVQYLNNDQNIWLTTPAVVVSSSSSSLNYVLDSVITSSNSNSNANLAADFTTYSSYSGSSSSSNKTSAPKDKGISQTKRVWSSSSRNDAAAKKQRAPSHQSSCSLPKVVKEKIGDRIAALHRLVAPFGKTDAASVLTEAIGYIQFLHHQIQTLSTACIKPSQRNPLRCFQGVLSKEGDLTSRGLSLVPTSVASYISSSTVGLHSSCIDDDKFYYN